MPHKNVTRESFSQILHSRYGFSKIKCRKIVDLFFLEIEKALLNGEDVKISGFGNFILSDKKARPARDLFRNSVMEVKPRRVVSFKPGFKLKSRIRGD